MFIIKIEINVTERQDLADTLFPESLWCSIEIEKEKTVIGICHRSLTSLIVNDEALFKKINIASKEKVLTNNGRF